MSNPDIIKITQTNNNDNNCVSRFDTIVCTKKGKAACIACQKERATNAISGRHIFFKSKRMPKHNIDCPSKETGNRKQPTDAIYITYLLTRKMVAFDALGSLKFWKKALLLVSFKMSTIQSCRSFNNMNDIMRIHLSN